MTRISKQNQRRAVSPRRPSVASTKTGPKKDNLPKGYREHENTFKCEGRTNIFIPKIK